MAFETAEAILSPEGRLETHPDFFYQQFELFSVKDSQELRRKASLRPLFGNSKVFVVEILSFSIESANALLKTFEEPYEGTHFFVIVPSLEDVIPTLRSRLTVIDSGMSREIIDEEKKKFYEKFLRDLPAKRLDVIQNIIKNKEKEKGIEFLNELEVVVAGGKPTTVVNSLEQIQKCRDFLYQRGGSLKMVLEHLALTLPQM